MVNVFYSYISNDSYESSYLQNLMTMPNEIQQKNLKFKRIQDKYLHLAGKLLLRKGLNVLNSRYSLKDIKYNEYSRPFFFDTIDFNISHSDKIVVCAIGENVKIGIDIEKIRTIDFHNYKSVLTLNEFKRVNLSNNKHSTFFQIWTVKESISKAIGSGMYLPFKNIEVEEGLDIVKIKGNWYIYSLNINKGYCCHIALSKREDFNIERIQVF